MIDLTRWWERTIIERDIDQPIASCTLEFTRAMGVTQSLSPLRTDSVLNRMDDGITYAAQLDLNRAITVEVATTAIGSAINSSDMKLMFKGGIDSVGFERSPVVCQCRDEGATLVDTWIEFAYPITGPVALETHIQTVINSWVAAPIPALYTPVSPAYNVNSYQQQPMSVMDALQTLAQLRGLALDYRWDNGTGAFRLTLRDPDRSKSAPDYTFGPSGYIDVTGLELNIRDIRNWIEVIYPDYASASPGSVAVSDATSILTYKKRYFRITEPTGSPIDTNAEATAMAGYALADLKDPKADLEIELPFFWPCDLGDLYRFSPNGVHFNNAQDYAVVSIRHELSAQRARTTIRVRGKPAGQYFMWRSRVGATPRLPSSPTAQPPIPKITHNNTESDDTGWDLAFSVVPGDGGGGLNLTYTIKSKISFSAEATLYSGNATGLPASHVIPRHLKYETVISFNVLDFSTGQTATERITIPGQRQEVDTTGHILRGRPLDDGSYSAKASTNTGLTLDSAVADSTGSEVRKALHKAAHTDPDTLDSVPDGSTWKRITGVVSNKITPSSSTARNRVRATITGSAISITSGAAPAAIAWNGEDYDSNALHDNVTNNNRITVPSGGNVGVWFFNVQINWSNNAVGVREATLRKNGATTVGYASGPGVNSSGIGPTSCISAYDDAPAVGDYYEVLVYQDSGATLSVNTQSSFFSATHQW